MSALDRFRIDKDTFRKIVADNPEKRFEYEDGFLVQQMVGATRNHHVLSQRVSRALSGQLNGSEWLVLTERGVDTGQSLRYGDIVVEPAAGDPQSVDTSEPALIVEILSKSSQQRDLVAKRNEYCSLPSLHAYVVASQEAVVCLGWLRQADGTFPVEAREFERGDTIQIVGLGVSLELADIYDGLELGGGVG